MWIEERNGKYRACERYTDYYTGKQKRVSVTLEKNTAATRRLAAEQLNKIIESRMEKETNKNVTLKELVEQYRIYQFENVKLSTYTRNYRFCNTMMRVLGEDVLVDKLNVGYIKKKFAETQKGPGTLNEYRTRLKALLNWGYENDYIKDVSFMKKFKPYEDISKRKKIEDKFLESSEVKLLLASMNEESWKLLTEFLVLSGLRFGEAAALSLNDVDKTNRVIHVRNTYDTVNKVISSAKTDSSIRDIFIQDELLLVLNRISVFMKLQRLSSGCGNPYNLFFQAKDGGYIQFYSFNKYLKENCLKTLNRKITPHTLRHTHASLLMEQGVPIDTISRRLGHHDSKITKEIYIHITEKRKKEEADQIRSLKII